MNARTGVILLALLVAASLLCSVAAVFLRSRLPVPLHAGPETASAVGVLKDIDPSGGSVLVRHQAIATFGMPDMTMSFLVSDPQLLVGRSEGDAVTFTLRRRDGAMILVDLRPSPPPVRSEP